MAFKKKNEVNNEMMPAEDAQEDNNLTDTNGAPAAMDEDGAEVDSSPTIQKLIVGVFHPAGSVELQTDITATIHAPHGFQQKRLVVNGGVSAKRLGELLAGVASW